MTDPPASLVSAPSVPDFEPPGLGNEIVYVVDDDEQLLDSLDRFLAREGFNTATFSDPRAALDAMSEWTPRVMVTDQHMPGMSGLELGEKAQEVDPEIRIIVMTGVGDEAIAQASLRLGAVDYLTKPLALDELARTVRRSLLSRAREEYNHAVRTWLWEAVEAQTRTIRDVTLGALSALVNALEARSPHFRGHSRRVSACAGKIARALDLPVAEVEAVRTAGLLHDIGMIAVPDEVLLKPSALDPEEQDLVRRHCRLGVEILEPMKHLGPSSLYVLEHHERMDGSGYPDGKAGDAISLGGRIVGLADSWAALNEERTFRAQMSREEAMATLEAKQGTLFSSTLIEALRRSEC